MRKNLFVGSLLAAFLIMMVPMVSAAEYRTVDAVLSKQHLQRITPESLEKESKDPQSNTIIILTLLILFLKLVRWVLDKTKLSHIFLGLFLLWLLNLMS